MEVFAHKGFSKAKMEKINRCRLYLGVLTLSDVMNGYSSNFTCAYKCERDQTIFSNYNWPRQTCPGIQTIKVWHLVLQKTFGLHGGVTSYQLGKWYYPYTNRWLWLFSPTTELLYQ